MRPRAGPNSPRLRSYPPAPCHPQEFRYRQYIEQNLASILADSRLDITEKSQILYYPAQGLAKDVMAQPRSEKPVQRSKDMVENTISLVFGRKAAFAHLLKVTSYDYYTYTHSVNVLVFGLALAQRLGFDDPEVLRDFGVGALLHDIGKSMIDSRIVNCKTTLTDEQWRVMRLHPVYGHEILVERAGVGKIALDVIRHHHEKIGGTGYPDRLRAGRVSPLARVLAVADIFDALTTRRQYKAALNPFPALVLMKEQMSNDLDPEYFSGVRIADGRPGSVEKAPRNTTNLFLTRVFHRWHALSRYPGRKDSGPVDLA
jgi:putative nucleotidyltransferase with HDIG domain